jgi:hypothetical protein
VVGAVFHELKNFKSPVANIFVLPPGYYHALYALIRCFDVSLALAMYGFVMDNRWFWLRRIKISYNSVAELSAIFRMQSTRCLREQ